MVAETSHNLSDCTLDNFYTGCLLINTSLFITLFLFIYFIFGNVLGHIFCFMQTLPCPMPEIQPWSAADPAPRVHSKSTPTRLHT